ncbi:diacylglycerol kinase family lipid kinase [soil metagenome]
MIPRWLVAVNTSAGRQAVELQRVRAALDAAAVEADVEVPIGRSAMADLVKEAVDVPRLAVVGGDGTVNVAVNALLEIRAERLPILGVLPSGTGCDLLRTFGIPQRLEEAAHHLKGDAVYVIDVGELEGSFGVRRFANVAQAGVGAAAAATAARLWRGMGSQRYIGAFGMRLPRFPGGDVHLETDRRDHSGRALAVIVANAQYFAGGWNIAPKATMVDGLFDLQVIDVPKSKAVSMVPLLMKGLHLSHPGVRRISAGWFRLETQHQWPVEVDGDFIGNTPVEGRVLPAAIRLKI